MLSLHVRYAAIGCVSVAVLLSLPAAAQQVTGRVVSISDGDTLTVLDVNQRQHKIRLADIDAPERKQPFGAKARQSLADLCFQKPAQVSARGKDRYGRTIGQVACAGQDASAHQVRLGMAWVFDRYAPNASPLYSMQREARAAHRGLWSEQGAVAPWIWRSSNHHAVRGESQRAPVAVKTP